jgi:hypothetical protein
MVPLGWMYSSLTGMGSATSQSSSEMCSGLPVSRETILAMLSVHVLLSPCRVHSQSYLSQVYSAHQTRLRISASNGP